jgi:hypothetical protein
MRIFATSALVCCAIAALFPSSARADFVLNCRLLDTNHPIWKQHCKAQTRELARVRCRDRLECLALKKLIFLQTDSIDTRAGVSPGPSVTGVLGSAVSGAGSTLGGAVQGAGSTLGGTVQGAGSTVGGVVNSVSPTAGEIVRSTTSAAGGAVSGTTDTIGNTVTGAGNTVGSTLNK